MLKEVTQETENKEDGKKFLKKTCHPTGQDDELGGHRSAQDSTEITQHPCCCVSMWM